MGQECRTCGIWSLKKLSEPWVNNADYLELADGFSNQDKRVEPRCRIFPNSNFDGDLYVWRRQGSHYVSGRLFWSQRGCERLAEAPLAKHFVLPRKCTQMPSVSQGSISVSYRLIAG